MDLADAERRCIALRLTGDDAEALNVLIGEYGQRGGKLRQQSVELERLRAQANCGEGHDPEQICCTHAKEVKEMRAELERLRAIEAATRRYVKSTINPRTPEERRECSVAWRDLNDLLGDVYAYRVDAP